MITPKDLGRLAQRQGINAPSLDEQMACWLERFGAEAKTAHMIHWWEGWYEGLEESLSLHNVSFTTSM